MNDNVWKNFIEITHPLLISGSQVRALAERQKEKAESSVYRILKKQGLITAPSHIVLAAADKFINKTQRVNEMWQTDFTYFKIIPWGGITCLLFWMILAGISSHGRYGLT